MDKTTQKCHEALAMLAQDGDMCHWTDAHTLALKDAVAVYAAERTDAERYRWLRDNPWPPILEADIKLHRNARWDAKIDAAMAAVGAA